METGDRGTVVKGESRLHSLVVTEVEVCKHILRAAYDRALVNFPQHEARIRRVYLVARDQLKKMEMLNENILDGFDEDISYVMVKGMYQRLC